MAIDEELRDHIKECSERRVEETRAITGLQGEVKGCMARLDGHSKTLDKIESAISEGFREMKAAIEQMDSFVDKAVDVNLPKAVDDLDKKVDDIEKQMTEIGQEVEKNKEAREASADLRKVIRDRVIWIAVPIIFGGFIFLAAESLGFIDMVKTDQETQLKK